MLQQAGQSSSTLQTHAKVTTQQTRHCVIWTKYPKDLDIQNALFNFLSVEPFISRKEIFEYTLNLKHGVLNLSLMPLRTQQKVVGPAAWAVGLSGGRCAGRSGTMVPVSALSHLRLPWLPPFQLPILFLYNLNLFLQLIYSISSRD